MLRSGTKELCLDWVTPQLTLERAVLDFDFAVFVFSPDDQIISRETQVVARDNVIFELGLFIRLDQNTYFCDVSERDQDVFPERSF